MKLLGPQRSSEAGIALLWAILIMLLVAGVITVMTATMSSNVNQTRENASRVRGEIWAKAAGEDLVNRVKRGEIGPFVTGYTSTGDRILTMPASAATTVSSGATFKTPDGSTKAVRMKASSGSEIGWYQVLPPNATVSQSWVGLYVRSSGRPDDQGAIEFVVRVWGSSAHPEPVIYRIQIRHATLARYSVLSDDPIDLAALGSISISGRVHTNNAANSATAITAAGVNLSGAERITSTRGNISPGCGHCIPNIRDVVSFGSANTGMAVVSNLSTISGGCGGAFVACRIGAPIAAPAGQMPSWLVDIAGTRCVTVRQANFFMRTDLGAYPMIDDRRPPASFGARSSYCPAAGGGAMILDGDIVVRGMRTGTNTPPVTVMARRTAAFPKVVVTDYQSKVIATNVPVTAPASAYLLQTANGAGVGSSSDLAPVGIVGEGGVYLPSYAMRTVNNTMNLTNVALMAGNGEIAFGPSILAIASDGAVGAGGGMEPGAARAAGYGYGTQLNIVGALATRRQTIFRYGASGSFLGYGNRRIGYPKNLTWNAPPFYPSFQDWHVSSMKESDAR